MDEQRLRQQVTRKMAAPGDMALISADEYYYLLAQVLNAVFRELGGPDVRRTEYNYLTNPSVRKGMAYQGRRIGHFLAAIRPKLAIADPQLVAAYAAVLAAAARYTEDDLNEAQCEDAFYAGLHDDNLFMRQR